ncbi:SurA N-terminal domain-containing protein [Candidatus Woesearchaeota archaeon]|nr:SurA N-terminal domain-containing protein [Candidatus Woesearchaeota archaeon]
MVNKNNNKEEIVIKKSTIITVAAVLVVVLVLILSWGRIDNLIKTDTVEKNQITGNLVAEVNGEEITAEELDESYDFFFFITGYPPEFQQFLTKETFLDQLINEKLLLQEVEKQGIELSDSEFSELKENAFGISNFTESELSVLLESNNITYEYFMEYYKKQVLITKLLNKTIINDIKVEAQEIEDYYEQNKADFENQTFEEVNESIKALLMSLEQREVLRVYLDELKTDADIKVYTEGASSVAEAATQEGSNECIRKYGLSDETIIFYHANWCPHCKDMVPIVEELEGEGYRFAWVDVEESGAMAVINDCFSDVVGQGVPEFICAGNKELKMGAMSKSALKKFADSCQ